MVKAQITSYERYKPDILVMKGDSLMEAETLGNEFRFPEDSNCFTTRMALEDKGKLNSLKLPDPRREGWMKGYLKAVTEASTKRRMRLPRNRNRSPNCLIWRDKPQAEVTSAGAL
jgi:uroporphyrinogen-III decarboxylase